MKSILMILFLTSFAFTQSILIDPSAELNIGTGADVCVQGGLITGNITGTGTICGETLPVNLITFSYTIEKNSVGLYWVTEKEFNNSGFDVERKNQNGIWQKIGFVKGSGTILGQTKYNFEDKKLNTGKYSYRIKQIDYNGNFEYFLLNEEVNVKPPDKFSMSQNYPNPFNPKTRIDIELPESGKVTVKIYDVTGKEIATLVNDFKEAGYYSLDFDGTNFSSGIYFYRIFSANKYIVKKMVILK